MLDKLALVHTLESSEGRRKLLNALTDLFLLDPEPAPEAKDDYAAIARKTLSGLDGDDRADYAGRVAAEPSLPHSLANELAKDEDLRVATMLLRLSPVLTDEDLAAIAMTQSQTHLVAIAKRLSLSEAVTDVLVTRGDQDVLRTVSGNEGARFSDSGLDTLMERGGHDLQIVGNMSARLTRLPASQAKRVLAIAQRVVVSMHGKEGAADDSEALIKRAQKRRREVKFLLVDIRDRLRTVDSVVAQLAEENRSADLAHIISTLCDIPAEHSLRALMQIDASAFGAACRSVGVDVTGYSAVLKLRTEKLGLPLSRVEHDLESSLALTPEQAERAIRFLKMRKVAAST